SRYHAYQAYADSLMHGQAVVERQQRSQNHTTADAGQSAEPTNQEADHYQGQEGNQRHSVFARSIFSRSIRVSISCPAWASARSVVATDARTIRMTKPIIHVTGSR